MLASCSESTVSSQYSMMLRKLVRAKLEGQIKIVILQYMKLTRAVLVVRFRAAGRKGDAQDLNELAVVSPTCLPFRSAESEIGESAPCASSVICQNSRSEVCERHVGKG